MSDFYLSGSKETAPLPRHKLQPSAKIKVSYGWYSGLDGGPIQQVYIHVLILDCYLVWKKGFANVIKDLEMGFPSCIIWMGPK